MDEHEKSYKLWIENTDEETKEELISISQNKKEIYERFCNSLKFGTAGLRGIIGSGLNRINKFVISHVTQALCNVINKSAEEKKSVVIAYDSRNKSKEFAECAATVIAANDIKVLLFSELTPVPILSFAVRHKKATAGIVITASHNAAKYNGYKVYGRDGAQMSPIDADMIFEEIKKIDMFKDVKKIDFKEAIENKKIELIGKKIYTEYFKALEILSINSDVIAEYGKKATIVYTPLHGSGNKFVRKILKNAGFLVYVVPEQEEPDGNFPTVEFPNPEHIESFDISIKHAQQSGSDFIIGTDPDSDRIGVVIRQGEDYVALNGNQIGILLCEYILSQLYKKNGLPKNPFIAKSIVSTNMVKNIAEAYGVAVHETLTGFKFIGELIRKTEESGEEKFIFGFEESFGYLIGTHARDKDAIVASLLISEMYLYYKFVEKIDLIEKLKKIYEKYGYFKESTVSLIFEGIDGIAKISSIMSKLRSDPPNYIGQKQVIAIRDYETGIKINKLNGEKNDLITAKADVLYFELEGENNFIARPSGTEPKIKFYCLVAAKSAVKAEKTLDLMKTDVEKLCTEQM